jgi:hypothetical protein
MESMASVLLLVAGAAQTLSDEYLMGISVAILATVSPLLLQGSRKAFVSEGGKGWIAIYNGSRAALVFEAGGVVMERPPPSSIPSLWSSWRPERKRAAAGAVAIAVLAWLVLMLALLAIDASEYRTWDDVTHEEIVEFKPEFLAWGLMLLVVFLLLNIGAIAAFLRTEVAYALSAPILTIVGLFSGVLITEMTIYYLVLVVLPFTLLALLALGLLLSATKEFE